MFFLPLLNSEQLLSNFGRISGLSVVQEGEIYPSSFLDSTSRFIGNSKAFYAIYLNLIDVIFSFVLGRLASYAMVYLTANYFKNTD